MTSSGCGVSILGFSSGAARGALSSSYACKHCDAPITSCQMGARPGHCHPGPDPKAGSRGSRAPYPTPGPLSQLSQPLFPQHGL